MVCQTKEAEEQKKNLKRRLTVICLISLQFLHICYEEIKYKLLYFFKGALFSYSVHVCVTHCFHCLNRDIPDSFSAVRI